MPNYYQYPSALNGYTDMKLIYTTSKDAATYYDEPRTAVWLAEAASGKKVAIKRTIDLGDYWREVRALEHLGHNGPKSLVTLLDTFEYEGDKVLVFPYVGDRDLPYVDCESVSLGRFLVYMYDVVDALEYCHTHNIAHLDIKPDNIRITEDDGAVLIDFGRSRRTGQIFRSGDLNIANWPIEYSLFGAAVSDPAIDLFSIARVMDEYSCRAVQIGRVHGFVQGYARSDDRTLHEYGEGLYTYLRRGIAVNRARRPRTAAEVKQILGDLLDSPDIQKLDAYLKELSRSSKPAA